MNSKEALENIKHAPAFMGGHSRYISALESRIPFLEDIEIIKQDLDKLEKLKKENKELRKSIKSWNENAGNLLKEILKLKKTIEILKEAVDEIEFITCDEEDCYGEVGLYQKINGSISIPLKTKEEYILVKEILNER